MADYYYTDANRQPAGPVPLDELRSMFQEGKLANGALVAEVGASEWKPAAEVLGGSSTTAPPYSAPPVTPTAVIGSTQEPFEPLAGWAFGLGLASWLCISILGAIPGAILGHMALGKMKREGNNNQAAKVLAIIGLVLSYVQIGGTVVMIGFFGLMAAAGGFNP
ncbi:MAG: DUF4190 domain-containing protein [Phycisphaerales bacterium]|jgi:hypothetical protein